MGVIIGLWKPDRTFPTVNKEKTLLLKFFRKLLCLMPFLSHRETGETRSLSYGRLQEFSDTTVKEVAIRSLQRVTGVVEEYSSDRQNQAGPVTRLIAEENGVKQALTFHGAIPELFFPQLLQQNARLTVVEIAMYDPGVGMLDDFDWRCSQEETLEVLTGQLAGQQFSGRRYWIDDYPIVVTRIEERQKRSAEA